MLIAIDIGNSTTGMGIFVGDRLIRFTRTSSSSRPDIDQFMKQSGMRRFITVIACSVVPQKMAVLRREVEGRKGIRWLEVGKNIVVRVAHHYRPYHSLGDDRKVNVFGAQRLYRPPFLIVDGGTAITIDYVSEKGVFEGGLIFPGPRLALEALQEKTALLPLVSLKGRVSLLGRSTRECIRSGTIQGYVTLLNGLIRSFRSRYGKKLRVIGTGGSLEPLRRRLRGIDVFNPLLTVRSLHLLYKDQVFGLKA